MLVQVLPCLLFPEDSKDTNCFTFNDEMTLVSSERNGNQGKRKLRFALLQSRIFTGLEDFLYLWTKVNSFCILFVFILWGEGDEQSHFPVAELWKFQTGVFN